MRTQEKISTVRDLFAAFGGDEAFRDATGYTERQTSTWKSRGRLASHARLRVHLAAQERGIAIAPELVGLSLDATS